MEKCKYEIRQVDAWESTEGGFTWNNSIRIGAFETAAQDHKKAFLKALHKIGFVLKRGSCKVDFDGDIYKICERKTGKPLFAAIPQN